jgi:hypothetical protein
LQCPVLPHCTMMLSRLWPASVATPLQLVLQNYHQCIMGINKESLNFRSKLHGSDANPLPNGDDLTTFALHSDAFSEYHEGCAGRSFHCQGQLAL